MSECKWFNVLKHSSYILVFGVVFFVWFLPREGIMSAALLSVCVNACVCMCVCACVRVERVGYSLVLPQ